MKTQSVILKGGVEQKCPEPLCMGVGTVFEVLTWVRDGKKHRDVVERKCCRCRIKRVA